MCACRLRRTENQNISESQCWGLHECCWRYERVDSFEEREMESCGKWADGKGGIDWLSLSLLGELHNVSTSRSWVRQLDSQTFRLSYVCPLLASSLPGGCETVGIYPDTSILLFGCITTGSPALAMPWLSTSVAQTHANRRERFALAFLLLKRPLLRVRRSSAETPI
jgi:hypothetical protein